MPVDPSTLYALALYALLLTLPGLAILTLLGVRPADVGVRLGLAVGLGLALQPLAYLWADALGLRLGPVAWWLVLAVAAAVVLVDGTRRWSDGGRPARPVAAQWALLALLLATLGARWWAARDLTMPLWGDGFQHSLMVRLFLEQGGLPGSWRPYAELATFTYHFGLHGSAATLAWLSGLPAERAVLVAGQALMVLQVLTLYALAAGLTGRPWAGVGAGLAAAGLGPMPGYYLNWGRYTQLAGQVVLPAAALASAGVPRLRRRSGSAAGRALAVAGLAVAGLALTHYLVTVFFVAWALAWVLVGADVAGPATEAVPPTTGARALMRAMARRAVALVPVAACALVLVLPWLPRFLAGVLDDAALRLATTRVGNPDVFGIVAPAALWGSPATVDRHLGLALVAAAGVAAVYGLARRDRLTALGLAWGGLMLLAAYPGLVGLPVSGLVKDFTVAIGLYLPLGLVLGGGLGTALDRPARVRPWVAAVAVAVVAAVAVLFAANQRDLVDRQFMLATPADEDAMAWIRASTPPEAVFLVSSFDAFGGTVQAGDDGGWWLPVLTGRRTTVPPITVGTERAFEPDYRERLNRLAEACRASLDGAACQAGLTAFGVTHAYVGPTGRALPRAALAASRHWQVLYEVGGARVYRRLP